MWVDPNTYLKKFYHFPSKYKYIYPHTTEVKLVASTRENEIRDLDGIKNEYKVIKAGVKWES